jgi:hypothetical protein
MVFTLYNSMRSIIKYSGIIILILVFNLSVVKAQKTISSPAVTSQQAETELNAEQKRELDREKREESAKKESAKKETGKRRYKGILKKRDRVVHETSNRRESKRPGVR